MDGTSYFFTYGISSQSSGDNSSFDGTGGHQSEEYHVQQFNSVAFGEDVPSQPVPLSVRPLQPPPLIQSSLPARTSTQCEVDRYDLGQHQRRLSSASNLKIIKPEQPGSTTGSVSSATPETKITAQIVTPITPKITPLEKLSSAIQPSNHPEMMFAPPALVIPRRRRTRRSRPKPQLTEEEEEAKRERFLARNRVAAGKCRVKRKSWVTDLEETKLELEDRNSRLRLEHGALTNEASHVRALLMAHGGCNDSRINKWIENEANRYVLGTGEQYDSMMATFGMTLATQPRNDSMSSISGYATTATGEIMSPIQRAGLSMPLNMSPQEMHNASASLPPGPPGLGMPGLPALYRSQALDDSGTRQLPAVNQSYLISPPTQHEDPSIGQRDFERFPGHMM